VKKLLLAAAIIFCAVGLAQAVIIDDFTQDRNFRNETSTTALRTDATKAHIIGGRCDITFNIYAGGGGNPSLVFFMGSESYEGTCYTCDDFDCYPYSCTIPAYPAAVSYNSDFSSSGDWTLEYGKSVDLNANLTCAGTDRIKIDFDGDMYGGGGLGTCSNPDTVYGCPRPVPVTMTLISKKGTPQQATASKTINLVNPIQTPATAYFIFSDFSGIDFTDVDYIALKFDNVAKNAVDYSVFKIYTDCSTAITLSQFKAIPGNGQVVITWKTETETDNAGFNLYRSEKKETGYVKINDALIPATASATQAASYQFIDTPLKNRKVYYYILEDVDLSGTATKHGPVKSIPRFIHGMKK
jgi:hypothetical protein